MEAYIGDIVARSRSIFERMDDAAGAADGRAGGDGKRLVRWRKVVSPHEDPALFEARLRLDGLDAAAAGVLLDAARPGCAAARPGWADVLDRAGQACAVVAGRIEDGSLGVYACLDAATPQPFEELLLPFVQAAQDGLKDRIADAGGLLSDDARAALERSLLRRLVHVGASTFELEFSVFRALRRHERPAPGAGPRALYDTFVHDLLATGYPAFLREYSVLARLLATAAGFWIDGAAEFAARLSADLPALQAAFGGRRPLGKVAALQTDLSDAHHAGRSASVVTFESGVKVVYKPKDLGMDVAFFSLLAWVNERGFSLPLKTLRVLNARSYGWAEFVAAVPCERREALGAYYHRVGGLLCLIYALEGTDCHHENLIASGEHPVVIDLETLFHPLVRDEGTEVGAAQTEAMKRLYHSVLRTGMLPQWQAAAMGGNEDISGFGVQEESFCVLKWNDVNTDRMARRRAVMQAKARYNLPAFEQETPAAAQYVDAVTGGFEEMYRLLMAHRAALLARGGPLDAFKEQRVRFVFRPSQVYASLLDTSLNPDHLRDGADRSIHLDALSRALLEMPHAAAFWPILRAEHEALFDMDIPHFTSTPDRKTLPVARGAVLDAFDGPTYDVVRAGLNDLSEADLAEQIGYIRGSLSARPYLDAGRPHRPAVDPPAAGAADAGALRAPERAELLDHARGLADEIRRLAIASADGTVSWIAPSFVLRTEQYQLKPLSPGLYDGTSGIALFFAALYRLTGEAACKDFALRTLRFTRNLLADDVHRSHLAKSLGISGAGGCGSIVYALTTCSRLLEEDALLEPALQAAALITHDRIERDEDLDVIYGAAGALLALLPLYRATGETSLLDRIVRCGEHLLEKRTVSRSGHRVWKGKIGVATGFSHGAAGIAYALLRLYGATGRTAFRDAAVEAVDYERHAFDPATGNWPKLTEVADPGAEPAWCSWCHGAAGIGTARLGALDVLDTPAVRADLHAALRATAARALHGIDNLCCGNMGRIDFLAAAAAGLSDPALHAQALEQTAQVLARARRDGGFALTSWENGPLNPTFFQGGAGAGYTFLRLAYPGTLPAIQLWE